MRPGAIFLLFNCRRPAFNEILTIGPPPAAGRMVISSSPKFNIFEKNLLQFYGSYIIISLVKRIYPSKIFFTKPLINYLYSPRDSR